MDFFVQKDSVVRTIWGKSDTILFIFAGAAAEFALNKAVDWLYFTGKLPKDPIGRLFSTVAYARVIVFSEREAANKAIDTMRHIHGAVEKGRGAVIPDWAYRDVLFMLIHYSIAAYELLERALSPAEKEEVYNVFYRVGVRMGVKDLPPDYIQWLPVREAHLQANLANSHFTADLFAQYRRQLGNLRFRILKQAQALVVPRRVKELLLLPRKPLLRMAVPLYKLSKKLRMDALVKKLLLPAAYEKQIKALDVLPAPF